MYRFLVLGLLVLGACRPAATPNPTASAPSNTQPSAPTDEPLEERVLVWNVTGAAGPGQQGASSPGQIALVDDEGTLTPLMNLTEGTRTVTACGDEATSPDGEHFAFYAGLNMGNLYVMTDLSAPRSIADVRPTTCLGAGTFQYMDDSTHYGYLALEDASLQEYPVGTLFVRTALDDGLVLETDGVIDFDMANEQVSFVTFFTNNRDEADEASISIWTPAAGTSEVTVIRPDGDDCRFTNASVARVTDADLAVILGQRCLSGDTRTRYLLYSVNITERSAQRGESDFVTGSYVPFARTNNIFQAANRQFLLTIPDGITAGTTALGWSSLESLEVNVLEEQQVVFPSTTPPDKALPRLSVDRRWLAYVVTSPNNDNELHVLDVTVPTTSPFTYSAGSRGDTISSLRIARTSDEVVFIAGGSGMNENSLVGLNLISGDDFRIARGRFSDGIALSPDGTRLAAANWQVIDEPGATPFLNLELYDVERDSGLSRVLFEGADVSDGDVSNLRFAYPLTWRRES